MYKILMLLILVCFAYCNLAAQYMELDDLKMWQLKGYGKSAEKLNDTYTGVLIYSYMVKKKPENIDFKWKLANQAYKARDYKLAYRAFDELALKDKKNSSKASFYKARCAMANYFYNEAIDVLDSLARLRKKDKYINEYDLLIENHLDGCQMALGYADSIPDVFVERLNESINNAHMELNPIFMHDSSMVYASTVVNELNFYEDRKEFPKRAFYGAESKNKEWLGGEKALAPFNLKPEYDAGACAFSLNKKRLYFTVCHENWKGEVISNLYVTHKEARGWSDPKKLSNGINLQMYSSSEPAVGTCYDPKLEVIYFVSDRPEGYGGTDIWYTIYDEKKDTYQKPVNAGIFLNTTADEASPFYDVYNHRLYFSSDGHVTMGGLDVMYANGEMLSWDEPVNVGVPINSSADDLFYIKNEVGNKGFVVSNRSGGNALTHATCCDDIFEWTASSTEKIWVEGKLLEQQYELQKLLKGEKSIDTKLDKIKPLNNAKIKVFIVRSETESDFVKDYRTDSLGGFKILLSKGVDYELEIDDNRVLERKISLNSIDSRMEELSVEIEPLAVSTVNEQALVMDNIYYEFNDSKLTSESKEMLDNTLLRLMRDYPELLVEIRSHTDDKGSARFNLRLSKQRSNSVVEYLIEKGIGAQRLKSVGLGESQPIEKNRFEDGRDNPAGRAVNRRTEFKLIDSDEISN